MKITIPTELEEKIKKVALGSEEIFCIKAIQTALENQKNSSQNRIVVRTDGASRGNPGASAAGYIVLQGNKIIKKGSKLLGNMTNNQAEYLALIFALENLKTEDQIDLELDSELAVKQIKGEYKVKHKDIIPLHQKVKSLLENKDWTIKHIGRNLNKEADKLANIALDNINYD